MTKSTYTQPICLEALEGRQLLSTAPWAFYAHLIGQDAVAQAYPALTGKGESIVVIDGGVNYDHPVLGAGFGPGHKVSAGWDFVGNDANPFADTSFHGTAVAGILAGDHYEAYGVQNQGIVPGANIIALRVNSQVDIKAAMQWALANRAKYNIVAVDYTDFGVGPYTSYTGEEARLFNAGVFVGTPAGNGGPSQYVYDDANSFTVGGIDQADQVVSFSARGPAVDMLGPAGKVMSLYYNVSTHTPGIRVAPSGTSWAAPYVVGAAAMIKQINPRFTVGQIMSILKDSGHSVYDPTSNRSYRRLDLLAAVKLAYSRTGAPAQTGRSPFGGTPIAIAPGGTVIQVENFDNGGEGLSYHDNTAANLGGQYRNTAVDVEKTSDTGGGYDVGWAYAGEWLEYTVTVPTTATYNFDFRLASAGRGGTFHVEQDGVARSGAIQVVDTGGWQKWQTGTVQMRLSAGTHVLRLAMDTNGASGAVANFNWFRIRP